MRVVSYWRNSLADSTRQDVPAKTLTTFMGQDDGPYAVARELLRDGVVPNRAHVQQILRVARGPDDEADPEEPQAGTCQVLICPLVARAAVVHTRRTASDDFVVPLYIPATLAENGTLSPPRDGAPWIPRDRLEPGRDTRPVIVGRTAAVDRFLSTNDPPDATAGWRGYWDHAWRMLESVAEDAGWRLSADGFDPGAVGLARKGAYTAAPAGFVLPQTAAPGMVEPLLAVYEQVCAAGTAPPLLARFAAVTPRAQQPPMDEDQAVEAHATHLGQMSDRHALAPSQRTALHHALALRDGDLLAINGPPGTGKTTLLQSVVASLWVRAALEEAEPPVVVAVSTNNQVVTNVIDSFGKAQQSPSPLAGRWVPDVTSYGLFCASQKQREAADSRGLQVAGERSGGFPAEVETASYVAEATSLFLTRAGQAFGRSFPSPEHVVRHLHAALVECQDLLRKGTRARLSLIRTQREAERRFGTVELAPLIDAGRREAAAVDGELRERQIAAEAAILAVRRDLARARADMDARPEPWEQVRRQWEAFDRDTPGWMVLLSWVPPLREHRRRLIRRFLVSIGADPPAEVRDPAEVDAWIGAELAGRASEAAGILASLEHTAGMAIAREEAEHAAFRAPREQRQAALRERLDALDDARTRLARAGAAWDRWVADRVAEAPELAEAGTPPPRLTSGEALDGVDRLTRVRAFQLATHYWEGRWLAEMRAQLDSGYRETQGRTKQEKRWRRYAKLTPCMVSTLFKAPSFFSWWDGEKPVPHLSFIDLLIVDEAGQVPPEVGGATFALAKRALIVGDTEQLQPVWRVSAWGDHGNLHHAGLAAGASAVDAAVEAGISAASGSAMHVAQRQSPRRIQGLPYGGMLLTEHYRCAPPIIAYCNELCYGGKLVPVRPPDERPPELPRMGYAHVPGASRRLGGSRDNPIEAWTVAQWIADHADALRRLGARARRLADGEPLPPLKDVVAVVTPFGAQARAIRAALGTRQVRGLTVDTVHALQGDERDVVVFSPVYARADGGSHFMLADRALLNVAVSRARESFLVFGDMAAFDARQRSPMGLLARHLLAARENELTDVEVRPDADTGPVRKLAGLPEHRDALRQFFADAERTVRITSPWLSADAVRMDGVPQLIADAVAREVQVTCYVDAELTADAGRARSSAAEAMRMLTGSGATLKLGRRIHNKTVAVDDRLICEGSFNWLSATRRVENPFHRYERSLVNAGAVGKMIQDFLADIESRVVRSIPPDASALSD